MSKKVRFEEPQRMKPRASGSSDTTGSSARRAKPTQTTNTSTGGSAMGKTNAEYPREPPRISV